MDQVQIPSNSQWLSYCFYLALILLLSTFVALLYAAAVSEKDSRDYIQSASTHHCLYIVVHFISVRASSSHSFHLIPVFHFVLSFFGTFLFSLLFYISIPQFFRLSINGCFFVFIFSFLYFFLFIRRLYTLYRLVSLCWLTQTWRQILRIGFKTEWIASEFKVAWLANRCSSEQRKDLQSFI
jgi:hypothetical protein